MKSSGLFFRVMVSALPTIITNILYSDIIVPSPRVHVGQGFQHRHAVIDAINVAIYFGIVSIKGSETVNNTQHENYQHELIKMVLLSSYITFIIIVFLMRL